MELRHLRYFVAVAEALSFTRAAQTLRLAQPSLTRQVRNLEDEIGVRLLDRAHNRIALTDGGRLLLFDARRILSQCAETIAAVQRAGHPETSQLNIGYVANIQHGLLPATLGAFRKLWPRVSLNLFDLTSADQYGALEARRIDLGFVGLRPSALAIDLASDCVAHDTMLVALPASHPLALRAALRLPDLAAEFFIGMSPKTHPGEREWLVATCRSAGFEGRILQESDGEPATIKFVADGLGVALMPAQIASSLPHAGVVFRACAPPLRRESTIAWRIDNPSGPLKDYVRIVKDLSRDL